MKTFQETACADFSRNIPKVEFSQITEISELPQETVTLRSTDFPVRIINQAGEEEIHLPEFQSEWKYEKVLAQAEYVIRLRRKYGIPKPSIILLKKNMQSYDCYTDVNS